MFSTCHGCQSITAVIIPATVKTIGTGAFRKSESLSSITILPGGITKIDSNTFGECKSISYVSIPNTVTDFGSNAFTGASFQCINWDPSVSRNFEVLDGVDPLPTRTACS